MKTQLYTKNCRQQRKTGKSGGGSPRVSAHQSAVQCQTVLKTYLQITVYLGKNIYVCMQQKLIKKRRHNFQKSNKGRVGR